jgi:hypothetical protein
MRKSEIKGIINDLLDLGSCENPLDRSDNLGEIEVNLLKKEISYPEHDEVYNFYKKKIEWFNERIDRFGGRPGFQIAKIFVSGRSERVEIVFMNETFLGEMKHEVHLPFVAVESIKSAKDIEEAKPIEEVSKSKRKKK